MSGVLHGVLASLKGAAASVTDTFFRYVSLLLNTTSTNGAQNNTFLDGSTNNFSITRNGNTTQGNFSPFSQTGWSNYFDGAGDWLSVPDNAAFDFGSGNFTVELWYYPQATPAETTLISKWNAGGVAGSNQWLLYLATATTSAAVSTDGTNSAFVATGPNVVLSQWNHIAFVRNGNSFTVYTNGVGGTPVTNTGTLYALDTEVVGIGYRRNNGSPVIAMQGYASQVRIVKGTAVYTANFTPPTAPLTAITNTSLLTCQSNRFIDNSSNAFTITRNGDVSVQAFSPFNPTAAWSASTNGGSGYFDGTGDFLSVANNTAFDFGSGNFTVECWVYPIALGQSSFTRIYAKSNASGYSGIAILQVASSYNVSIYSSSNGTSWDLAGSVIGTMQPFAWNHLAVTRSGTNMYGFLNGVLGSTTNVSTTALYASTDPVTIASQNGAGTTFFTGFVGDVRVLKGTAQYTANFTPPTAPLTAITNTSLLLNFTNAGIYDSASGNDLETVGNAQVSTALAKWGTTSMAFDGTGDWLVVPNRQTLRLGSADFTIEYWFYPTNLTGTRMHMNTDSGAGGVTCSYAILTSGSSLLFYLSSNGTTWNLANGVSMGTATLNTWQHVALVRSGSTFTPYLNGVAGTTATSTASLFDFTTPLSIGASLGGGSPTEFLGYIDDLRITNGVARYTANFTPPTAAFPVQ